MSRIVFIQKFIPHYRLPMFERLRELLDQQGHQLILVYGQPDPFEGSKVKMEYPDWGHRVDSLILKVFGRYLYWQKTHRIVKKGDIVIAEHAAKLLDNYLWSMGNLTGYVKLCYYGHGKNFQVQDEYRVSRWIKKLTVRNVSHWFAYTQKTVDVLLEQGVDPVIVTSVNNTLQPDSHVTRSNAADPHAFVYMGGLYQDKRIELLIEAAELIVKQQPDFKLHIIGDGPQKSLVELASDRYAWLTYHGSLYGEQRAAVLSRVSAILIPGAVGLIAIDSFHFELPLFTMKDGNHGPEIAYLESGLNSVLVEGEANAETFANAVLDTMADPEMMAKLQNGCRLAAEDYTIEHMAEHFMTGISSLVR